MSDTNPEGQNIPAWTLGWRMRRALAHAGLSVETMADDLGFERKSLSRWMNDKGAPPRPVYLKQWALITGVPYRWLIGHDDAAAASDLPIRGSRCNVPAATPTPIRHLTAAA